jgi:tetratricopeptide (TPR) repeat protein
MTRKQFDEARSHFAAALEIDPLSVAGSRTNMATDWILERNYSKARQVIDGMFELNPQSVAASGLSGWIQLIQGDCPGLRVTLGQVERWNPSDLERAKALLEAKCGQPDRARAMLAELEKHRAQRYVSPYLVAWAYSILGDAAKAVDRLNQAADNHDSLIFYMKLDPLFDTIRSQPRFQDLAKRIGLP